MKNKEKYAKEIVEIAITGYAYAVNKSTGELDKCSKLFCENCAFNMTGKSCCELCKEWAESEYKEPITAKRLAEVFNQEYPNYDIMVAKVAFRWVLNRYTLTEKETEE